jgi:sugar phosphate permease
MISFLLFAVRVDSRFNPLHRPARYTRARTVNWLLLGLLYISYYVGRYNLSVVNNEYVRSSLGATKESYGLVLTLGHFSYAVFMLVNGNVADRIGGKKAILIGAVGSACVVSTTAPDTQVGGFTSLTSPVMFRTLRLLSCSTCGSTPSCP